jgi:heptosyltransferase-3
MIVLPARARILVVTLRRLGDVLLTTPLIRTLKRAFPDAAIDALVYAGTEGILAGNPDLARVIAMPSRALADGFALARALWRHYDLSISAQSTDRPTFFAWVASGRSVGLVPSTGERAGLKRLALDYPVREDWNCHHVEQMLDLAAVLDVPEVPEVICPGGAVRAEVLPAGDYAVIHAGPMFRYKQWTVEGWRGLAASLSKRGLAVVATGGPAPEDRSYLDEVWNAGSESRPPVRRLDGLLTWPELTEVIRRAQVYVGPDTSVTHLAAATGAPTVALYGPTNPRHWGPWPVGGMTVGWDAAGTVQRRGNVWLVQNPLPCLPCQSEGCERRRDSFSRCLDELLTAQVLAAVDQALAKPGGKNSLYPFAS